MPSHWPCSVDDPIPQRDILHSQTSVYNMVLEWRPAGAGGQDIRTDREL
jgi:hypothetical protein